MFGFDVIFIFRRFDSPRRKMERTSMREKKTREHPNLPSTPPRESRMLTTLIGRGYRHWLPGYVIHQGKFRINGKALGLRSLRGFSKIITFSQTGFGKGKDFYILSETRCPN